MRGFRQFSAHLTKCHTCRGICTLSPFEQCDLQKTRDTTRLKCCGCHAVHVQSAAPATKTATHLLKTSQNYCACHTKRLSTRYKTRLNVTKCHACHAKRGNETFETSKNDPLCRTYPRHGHIAIARTVANGCGRLRTVADGREQKRNVERTHPQPPDRQSETGTLATHSGTMIANDS